MSFRSTRSLLFNPYFSTQLNLPKCQKTAVRQLSSSRQTLQQPPIASNTPGGANDYQLGPSNDMQPGPDTQTFGRQSGRNKEHKHERTDHDWKGTAFKMFEAASTTAASISILGLAGYAYHKYYKHLVLSKIEVAFNPGDPALALSVAGHGVPRWADTEDVHWVERKEQERINRIVSGETKGHYYLLVGEKGTGKTSMLLDAMAKINGENCSIFEAHADSEIFRSRLGKALDFEYHEDYIGSLFSIRGPRETSPILDIERAFNKLEKVALRRARNGRPLILIINSLHFLKDDPEGRDILELLQQRAEAWAAQNLVTVIFNSDDYWVYERLKQFATRMEVIQVKDLPKTEAMAALRRYRKQYFKEELSQSIAEDIYKQIGGRLSFLNQVAKSEDMLDMCREIIDTEKTWLLNQCGLLGSDMDDDVMDQQKFASSAMVLVKKLVEMEQDQTTYDPEKGHQLPELPLYKARQVMTRAEFIQQYDHINIFTIDCDSKVRADSVPMQNAFKQVCEEPGFAEYLQDTLQRICDIESLGRTREITIKDLWDGGKYNLKVFDAKGRTEKTITWDVTKGEHNHDD